MTFIDILYSIFIGPLQLIFEIIYSVANRVIEHPGLAIVVLSLIMNFLVLPLYKRSDAMQEAARDVEEKLREGVTHIKKTFSGDEQMMILQTYYRQNDYKPTDALNGSVSLLLEIPFFMAAYNFLSHLGIIHGVSLGPIADLGAPDGMLVIGGVAINVLPILMTLINVISSAIYLKGFPLKTKIQLYGMAGFFLVFLYTSPAGLVFYWTLNNLFSLVKTLFYKMKNPKKVLTILASLIGIFVLGFTIFVYEDSPKRELFMFALGLALQVPLLFTIVKKKLPAAKLKPVEKNDTKMFITGGLFLTVLVGLLIPSTLIAASPQEFIDITYFHNPLWYIVQTTCTAAGTFLVWFGVFYWISSPAGKVFFDRLIWVLCGIMLVNYMFFGTDLGIISSNLLYEMGMSFEMRDQLINLLVLMAVAAVMYIIVCKAKKLVSGVLLTGCIALAAMSGLNISNINVAVANVEERMEEEIANEPEFELSQTGQNVIVLMLDRAMGEYLPYILNEKPELKEQLAGFTYYSNTISYAGFTNLATPALYGGYEYTPIEMNKRDTESLADKHNEALKVMPSIFSENGYDVTVMDATYANYQWIPDMSIYDEYENIDTYITKGKYGDPETKAYNIDIIKRNFFCFSLMKTMPLVVQPNIYENGNYNRMEQADYVDKMVYSAQIIMDNMTAKGMYSAFMEAYNVLENMTSITKFTEEETNTFLMMTNDTTHDPVLLQEPEYVPQQNVDNSALYEDVITKTSTDGRVIELETYDQITHYHANMAAMIKVGEWLDYLRENGVYDNTRIIIVSDHGRPVYVLDELVNGPQDVIDNAELYYPLLLVKDFGATEFTTSTEFMTNADVPTYAFADLIENPTNPFTGNLITNTAKEGEQYITTSRVWDIAENNGNTFVPATWWVVKDNIWDKENWRYIDEVSTIPSELK